MFKKLFTINYNNKKFLILVDDNHRKTFLEVKDGSLTYPTLEDFKYLHKVYNEKDPLITYVTKYKYEEKIIHNDKLMDLKVAISTGLLAMSLFALTAPNSMATFEPTPTVASTMPADPYGWRYDMNYEESLQYLERVNHNQTVTKNDVILAINNNKNFGEREKTIAINLLSSMLELDPGMNLRAYYESMKDYTIEYVPSEELQEETNLHIDGYCSANRKLIKVAQNAEDFVIAHETYGGKHTAYVVVEAKKSIRNEKELSAALEQVRSYALLLSAKYAVIASQEGIWITASKVGYMSFINEYTWNELSDNDNMYQIKSIIGKNK